MTIKARLIASTAALLCVATVAIGTVAIGAVTTTMTQRIDTQLTEFLRQPTITGGTTVTITSRGGPQVAYQSVAMLLLEPDRTVSMAVQAGYSTDLLPLPRVPDPLPPPGEFRTVPAVDGSIEYRMVTVELAGPSADAPRRLVVAQPMTEVAVIRERLVATMVVTVVLVLVASAVVGWWITQRGLRPVEDMIDTAAAIADGDLSRRAEAPGHTEMGRLADSLNRMVGTLVTTIGDREAGQERLRRFLDDASHELRTPLATVSGYTELYESGGAPPGPKLDRAMSRIQAENRRMARLIEDMLLLARLDRDADRPAQTVDLRRLAADAVDDSEVTDRGHPVTLEAAEAVYVRGDESRLRQVLANLLDNARRHTPEGTPVRVSVTADGDTAELRVADEGPGVPEEHRERVFDRLYRVDASRSRATGGSGLGLAIVESIVAGHGGTVALADPGAAGGTVVVVRLPRAH
ncbi:two-component system OmpR family sensor kinase [Stackebrandtia albiflava]|uniref:histidine kinase n=1 Tax=Stackebrandtia albiflava TaxID=406432 RepID=A0A562UY11_9ACTN|nr:HAMP domain-containing sensor histidine kinase [Stackebrandtia albiflava]TWJ10509.1 two-component system OmpR family sensor kinase [Stackebrandtia albiflava]